MNDEAPATVTTDFRIRPATNFATDYEAVARLLGLAYPEERAGALELQVADALRDVQQVCRRWVAESAGHVVGVGAYELLHDSALADAYQLHLVVAPEHRGRGCGAALYEALAEGLEVVRPRSARVWVARDDVGARRFAEARGCKAEGVRQNLWFDLREPGPAEIDACLGALRARGVQITTADELAADPERDRRLYDLYLATILSIDGGAELRVPSFEEMRADWTANRARLDYVLVAESGGEYVGLWVLEPAGGGSAFGGALGVLSAWRHKGVASGLLAAGARLARRRGHTTLWGHTQEANEAILKATGRLGYQAGAARVLYVKTFTTPLEA